MIGYVGNDVEHFKLAELVHLETRYSVASEHARFRAECSGGTAYVHTYASRAGMRIAGRREVRCVAEGLRKDPRNTVDLDHGVDELSGLAVIRELLTRSGFHAARLGGHEARGVLVWDTTMIEHAGVSVAPYWRGH